MGHITFYAIINGLGWLWMCIRHPSKIEREKVLVERYKGSYENVGKAVMIVLVVLIFVMELLVEFIP